MARKKKKTTAAEELKKISVNPAKYCSYKSQSSAMLYRLSARQHVQQQ
jgi:hypothetical protein